MARALERRAAAAWRLVPWGLVPALMLMAIGRLDVARRVADAARAFARGSSSARFRWSAAALAWTLYANVASAGDAAPLPFVPLVNPLDLDAGARLRRDRAVACARARRRGERLGAVSPEALGAAAAALLLFWVTCATLRTLHHFADVPWSLARDVGVARRAGDAVARVVACSRSPRWSSRTGAVTALAWVAGAALLAVVVAKLFFVDLSQVGGVERIVSFMGVGVLLLVIGYMAPVPPRREAT